jgi:hypothetical protein
VERTWAVTDTFSNDPKMIGADKTWKLEIRVRREGKTKATSVFQLCSLLIYLSRLVIMEKVRLSSQKSMVLFIQHPSWFSFIL